ncbi:MAG: Crp/Fnr family transcriptional regulator [Chloroflexota bacterium]
MTSEPYGFLGERQANLDTADALRRVPLLRDLGDDHVMAIARHAHEERLGAGQVMVTEGDASTGLVLLLEGSAAVQKDGRRLRRLEPGEFFGEMALIDGEPRSATVIADTPVHIVTLESRVFNSLLDSDPDLWRKLLIVLCDRLRSQSSSPVD